MSTAPPPPPVPRARVGASSVISIAILLSRVLGLVRQKVFAHYLGNSDAAGAFMAALRIPNFLQNLFGEGVLSASFIPVYSRLRGSSAEADPELARKVAGVVGSLLAIAVAFLVLVGVWLTPAFVDLVAPGYSGDLKLLTIQIVRILFPGVGLLVLSAWCLGILNSHRKFFLSYIAPVFWNLALIAVLLVYGKTSTQENLVLALAWGSVAGSFLQFAVQVPFVFKNAGRLSFRVSKASLGLGAIREVFGNLGPVLISRGVVQLSAYIDGMIASFLGAAAVASLAYAQTLYLLPVSLFGMAVAAAELPEMSTSGGETEVGRAKLRARLRSGRMRIAFFVIPSVVAFLFLGRPLVALLYQTGKFSAEDSRYVWYILMGSCVGLLAATWGRLYSSAFYALKDTRSPLRYALVRVALTIALGLLFAFPLRPAIVFLFENTIGLPKIPDIALSLGAVGLTASAGLAGWIEFALLKSGLEKRIGVDPLPRGYVAKIWTAAVVSGALGLAFYELVVPRVVGLLYRQELPSLVTLAVYGGCYLAIAYLLGLDEIRALARKFKRR